MSRILVTGATGFVGAAVIRALRARGHLLSGTTRDAERKSGPEGTPLYVIPDIGPDTDWSRVVALRIGLLARTPQESGQDVDTRSYDLLADASSTDDFDPTDDKRQRRIFSSTIQVRNLRTD